MYKRAKESSGSITLEASISLTAFIFAIMTMLSVVNVCIVQARIGFAINATAKEISQYSYLYSLTGLPESQSKIAKAALDNTKDAKENVNNIINNVGTVFDSIDDLGKTTSNAYTSISSGDGMSIDQISSVWQNATGDVANIKGAGSSIYESFKSIASDPKKIIFGLAQMAASTTIDLATSHLIAAPLSKVMIQKHLVNTKNGDVESYLKSLGIVPSGGSYLNGLNFANSTFFPKGKSIITVTVVYKAKIIPLLPIKYEYEFCQTAKTNAWSAGSVTFKTFKDYVANDTLWTEADPSDRASLIRHQVIADLKDKGYSQVSGFADVSAYGKNEKGENEFVLISSMNPLWSDKDDSIKTLDDLNDDAIKAAIERLSGNIRSSTDRVTSVTLKDEKDGVVTYSTEKCEGAKKKVILVVPEDEGLCDRVQDIAKNKANTYGVEIEVVAGYGTGVSKVKSE